jgi:hypothetical protein
VPVQDELAADEALEARSAEQRVQLLLERAVQLAELAHCSLSVELVLAGREKPASEGRRECS